MREMTRVTRENKSTKIEDRCQVEITPIAHLHIHFRLIWKQTGAVL